MEKANRILLRRDPLLTTPVRAAFPPKRRRMSGTAIRTDAAPAPIGPYSQAVEAGGFLFCSGQVGLDPATGALAGDDVETQVHRALDNLAAVLAAAGAGFSDVVKSTIFLTSMADFTVVNRAYGARFGADTPPARSTFAVAALPLGAKVEIELIAALPRP
jgi:2-iminobutanoate/2-iminopropanoate deaminase